MATYKVFIRPALEYATSIWSPLASSTSINKLQVMQNAALRTATGCTQDTNVQHMHDKHSYIPYTRHRSSPVTIQTENTTSITYLTQTYNKQRHSNAKHTFLNNGRYTTNIPTDRHTFTTIDIKQTCAINIPQDAITRNCAHLHHTLAALKR